jgi:hypothetical protein
VTRGQYAVILVYSTSHAIRIEKLLQAQQIGCKLIPVPRQISSDCGVCVRILRSDMKPVHALLQAAGVEIQGLHDI